MAPPATHSQHCSRDNFVHDSTFELHDLPCLEVTDSEVINYDAVRLQVTEWSHQVTAPRVKKEESPPSPQQVSLKKNHFQELLLEATDH